MFSLLGRLERRGTGRDGWICVPLLHNFPWLMMELCQLCMYDHLDTLECTLKAHEGRERRGYQIFVITSFVILGRVNEQNSEAVEEWHDEIRSYI